MHALLIKLSLPVLAVMTLVACGGKPPATEHASADAGAEAVGVSADVAAGARTGGTTGTSPVDNGEEKLLNIFNWSDYIDPTVLEDFTRQTGIKINYDVFDSNEMLETRLLAGNTGYDLVVPSASFMERQIKVGVFQKLDKAQLGNLGNLDPEITQRIAQHDPGNEHAVNYLWGTSGVGFNVARIRERMPDAPVDSFAMFYDPKIVSRFKDCGVTLLDAPSEVIGTVLI